MASERSLKILEELLLICEELGWELFIDQGILDGTSANGLILGTDTYINDLLDNEIDLTGYVSLADSIIEDEIMESKDSKKVIH